MQAISALKRKGVASSALKRKGVASMFQFVPWHKLSSM